MAVCSSCTLDSRYPLFTNSLTNLVKVRGSSSTSMAKASMAEKPNQNFGLLFTLRLEVFAAALDFLEFFDVDGGDNLFVVPCEFESCMSTSCNEPCSCTCESCSYRWHGKH